MIEEKSLAGLAERYQTTIDNIVREYFQHLFLSGLYQEKESDSLFFKGGTALRLIWQSPRFSEDLDFAGSKISISRIESLMEKVLLKIEREGAKTSIDESKKTSGGYFAIFRLQGEDTKSDIQIEVSLRSGSQGKGEAVLIHSDLLPPYTLIHLDEKNLVREKVEACLSRGKARDFYDLYFILRSRMAFGEIFAKDKILKRKLLERTASGKLDLRSELKRFLPVSQHSLLKNFKSVLSAEIEKHLP